MVGPSAWAAPVGSPISTNASTATGAPDGVTINGLTSTLATSGRSSASRPSPTSNAATASRSTAASPRNSPSSRWVASPSIISSAVISSSGAGRKTTSAIASARMPPSPSITVGPNCSSRNNPTISSRLPRIIGATSTPTSPSSGRAAANSSVAAAETAAASGEIEPNQPTFGLVGDRLALELGDHRIAEHLGRLDGGRRGGDDPLVDGRQSVRRQQQLGLGLGEGDTGVHALTTVTTRPCRFRAITAEIVLRPACGSVRAAKRRGRRRRRVPRERRGQPPRAGPHRADPRGTARPRSS